MKAIAVFPKEKRVALIDYPEPKIGSPTQVKLKILEVGICGTDREICEFKYGTPPDDSDFLILGHESFGQVVEVGRKVTDFKIGDFVVVMVRRPCAHPYCAPCQANRQDFCVTGDFKERGINGLHGFMTEYVVDDQKYMLRVSPDLQDIGVLTEPLTIAEKGVREICCIQKRLPWGCNHNALVIGAGPIGLLATLVLVIQKFETYIYSLESETNLRAKIADAIGATYLSAKNYDLKKIIKKIAGNIDVIFDGTGASQLAFEMLSILGNNGIFVWTGIPGNKDAININAGYMMRDMVLKNQNLVGTVNAGYEDFKSAIQNLNVLSAKLNKFAEPIIQRYEPSQYAQVLLNPVSDIFKRTICFAKS